MPSKQIRIAQISDLHIKPPGQLAYGRVDTAKALERCVAALNAFEPRPDFVVISGDLADTPNAAPITYFGENREKKAANDFSRWLLQLTSDLVCFGGHYYYYVTN